MNIQGIVTDGQIQIYKISAHKQDEVTERNIWNLILIPFQHELYFEIRMEK